MYHRLVEPPKRPLPAIDTPWQTFLSMATGAAIALLPWLAAVAAHAWASRL